LEVAQKCIKYLLEKREWNIREEAGDRQTVRRKGKERKGKERKGKESKDGVGKAQGRVRDSVGAVRSTGSDGLEGQGVASNHPDTNVRPAGPNNVVNASLKRCLLRGEGNFYSSELFGFTLYFSPEVSYLSVFVLSVYSMLS